MSPNIMRALDVANAHAPSPDAIGKLPYRSSPHDYGWTVWLGGGEDGEPDNVPEWFLAIVRVARRFDCVLVNFDQDAETLDALECFQW